MSSRIGWIQLVAWLILGAGVTLSGLSYLHFLNRTAAEAQTFFEEEARDAQRALETRLASHASLLLGLRGLHGVAGVFDGRTFTAYIDKLEVPQRFPAVRGLHYEGWPAQGRVRRRLSYGGPFGGMPPAEPDGALPAMDGHPGMLDEVRDSGDFALSGSPPVGGDAAISLRMAVYDRRLPADTVARRRLAVIGSVGMDISLVQLIRDAISVQTLQRIRISMYTLGRQPISGVADRPASRKLILDTSGMAEMPWMVRLPAGAVDAPLTRTSRMVFGGAVFELVFGAPSSVFVSPLSPVLPIFVLLAGVIISFLLFSLVNSLGQSRRRLELAVAERTRDLEAINQALHDEMTGRGRLEREIFHLNVDERRRFSRELHDSIGQQLAAIGLMLESLAGELQQGPGIRSLAVRASGYIASAIAQTGMLAQGLNPVAVEAGGFASALARLAASTSENFRVDCRLEHDGQPGTEDAVLQHNLYRIAQQAITNAITHGRASRIVIRLSIAHQCLRMAILDNGIGLETPAVRRSGGLGLKIMRYRCSVLGLDLSIGAAPEGGTAIVVEQRPPKD